MKSKKPRFTYLAVVFSFIAASFLIPGQGSSSSESPGKLSKVHGELSGQSHCMKCHTAAKKVEPENCLHCHTDLALRMKGGKGFHKDKREDCSDCHSEHNGEDHKLVQWDAADFDHSETGYTLTGSHRKIKTCDRCHNSKTAPPRKYSKTFLLKDNRCSACHKDAHRGNQPQCTDCHTTKDWKVDIW